MSYGGARGLDTTAGPVYAVAEEGQAVTEAEWLASDDPSAMLDSPHLTGRWRQARLFACACVRQVWHLSPHDWVRRTVEATEQYIDGEIGEWEAVQAYEAMQDGFRRINAARTIENHVEPGIYATLAVVWAAVPLGPEALKADREGRRTFTRQEPRTAVRYALDAGPMEAWRHRHLAGHVETPPAGQRLDERLKVRLAGLLRDMVGPLPFRAVAVPAACRTSTVLMLARAAYEERLPPRGELDDTRLLVLADALEEAGCPGTDLLDHLRSAGPHVRGCWVVDLIQARS